MPRSLTHLSAWRLFESAARLGSFGKAAEELHVTPAAVSQQIRMLEQYLDVQLFRRESRGVVLTERASLIYPEVSEGFGRLAAAVRRLTSPQTRDVVTVTVPPSFAAKWLVPRLERFRAEHPRYDVRLHAGEQLADFMREEVDLGVRYGYGVYPGLVVEKLLDERIFPVCHPKLAAPHSHSPTEWFRNTRLIHDTTMRGDLRYPDWSSWLRRAGIVGVDVSRGLEFNSSLLATQAALDGHGVALGRSVIVADDLACGRLVAPFDCAHPLTRTYSLVRLDGAMERGAVSAFRAWLHEESASWLAARGHAAEIRTQPDRPLSALSPSAEWQPRETDRSPDSGRTGR
jgi:LysR family transcriptional regulator, glycine cleavage system transcriptional activator